jgi:hypothetical protein
MNKPSERIVVFVTPAQKRAIAATAEELGISVSELMRRAVLSFGATSEQVKAAGIVDRLHAPREPDALNAALARVARGTRNAPAALPAAPRQGTAAPAAAEAHAAPEPLLPADVLAALVRTPDEELAAAQAAVVQRVTTAEAASYPAAALHPDKAAHPLPHKPTEAAEAPVLPVLRRRMRIESRREEDDPLNDPTAEDGRFA